MKGVTCEGKLLQDTEDEGFRWERGHSLLLSCNLESLVADLHFVAICRALSSVSVSVSY